MECSIGVGEFRERKKKKSGELSLSLSLLAAQMEPIHLVYHTKPVERHILGTEHKKKKRRIAICVVGDSWAPDPETRDHGGMACFTSRSRLMTNGNPMPDLGDPGDFLGATVSNEGASVGDVSSHKTQGQGG